MTALYRHARIGQRDILADRAVEQHVLLQHHADLPPSQETSTMREIDAVDKDAPALGHIEALHELGESRFARA